VVKIFLFCFLLTWLGKGSEHLYAYEDSPDESCAYFTHIFVSLGASCEIAAKLSEYELRCAAFPFDWLLSSDIEGVVRLLDDDFEWILKEEHLKLHPYQCDVLVNDKYHLEFRHDWRENAKSYDFWHDFASYREKLPAIKEKYLRRINRFKTLNQYEAKVFFIRVPVQSDVDPRISVTKEQCRISEGDAIKIRNQLKRYFPCMDFKLIIINFTEEFSTPMRLEEKEIIEFKFSKSNKQNDYRAMFDALLKY
jgi:hypothetical protein